MTITCDRWKQIAFSSEYYRSGPEDPGPPGLDGDHAGRPGRAGVCAPRGTSSMDTLARAPPAIAVCSDSHTGCLVLFQQGQVDAITGDDTVLAGLAAQDPYAEVPEQKAFTDEPYGLGINARTSTSSASSTPSWRTCATDGEWTEIYDRWLRRRPGPGAGAAEGRLRPVG